MKEVEREEESSLQTKLEMAKEEIQHRGNTRQEKNRDAVTEVHTLSYYGTYSDECSGSVCTCVCACVHVCMCACVHVCMCACVCVHICTYSPWCACAAESAITAGHKDSRGVQGQHLVA